MIPARETQLADAKQAVADGKRYYVTSLAQFYSGPSSLHDVMNLNLLLNDMADCGWRFMSALQQPNGDRIFFFERST